MRTLIVTVCILAVCVPVAFARKWTDSTRKYTVEAEFVDFKDGKVRLKKKDGSLVIVPLEKLCKEDQAVVRSQSPSENQPFSKRAYALVKPLQDKLDEAQSAVAKAERAVRVRQRKEIANTILPDDRARIDRAQANLDSIRRAVNELGTRKPISPRDGGGELVLVASSADVIMPDGSTQKITVTSGNARALLAKASSELRRALKVAQNNAKKSLAGAHRRELKAFKVIRLKVAAAQNTVQQIAAMIEPIINEEAKATEIIRKHQQEIDQVLQEIVGELKQIMSTNDLDQPARQSNGTPKRRTTSEARQEQSGDRRSMTRDREAETKPAPTVGGQTVELPKEMAGIAFPSGKDVAIKLSDVTVARNGLITVELKCQSGASATRKKAPFDAAAVFWVTKNADLHATAGDSSGVDFSGPAGIVAFWVKSSATINSQISLVSNNSRNQITGGLSKFDVKQSRDGKTVKAIGSIQSPIDDLVPQAIGIVLVSGGKPVSNFLWVPVGHRPAATSTEKPEGKAKKDRVASPQVPDSGSFESYELTAEEAKHYRANQSQANLALTGNIFDNQTGTMLLTDSEIKEIRAIGSNLDFKKPTDRLRYVREFVRILGKERARKVGVIFYDAAGRAKYVWPKPKE